MTPKERIYADVFKAKNKRVIGIRDLPPKHQNTKEEGNGTRIDLS
jgi:hypothetical protein